jgi:pyrroline-5-carboxylate reductase
MRLLLIGGGNMGGAIVRGVLARRVLAPGDVGVVEVDSSRREALQRLGCQVFPATNNVGDHITDTTQMMFAVKPQMFASVAQSLHDAQLLGSPSRVFVSIMAGLDSGKMHHVLGPGARIIRCMPNTPCQIGKGMTAIALGMGAREGDEDLARQIFDALGRTVMVEESLMHAVTAVSGSGPAYLFLMAEAMQRAAEAIDLSPEVARLLVTQTIVGAAGMLDQPNAEAAALRRAVTSPRGTTEAALTAFEQQGFERIVMEAVTAARDRGIELNAA